MGKKSWHQMSANDALEQLSTNEIRGLTTEDAKSRLEQFGSNALIEKKLKSPGRILWEQLTATLVVILIIAALISFALGDYKDAIVILVIVGFNALLGLQQEYRAERAMAALRKLAVPVVKVRRDDRMQEISARNLVPGDIVLLDAGSTIPADGRLVESPNLQVQESALTGESAPVEKDASIVLEEKTAIADRQNMVFQGTTATFGRGLLAVTETGMQTELGKIATMLQSVRTETTPLQRRLAQLGKGLAIAALVVVAIIFTLGMLRGEPLKLMFLTSVSMAVAAVPEGLPAVVTIALTLGAQRMLRRNVLIRKLPAVETLGSVTTICSDKTGTLTKNEMTVVVLDVAGKKVDVTKTLTEDESVYTTSSEGIAGLSCHPSLGLLLAGGALCNDAEIQQIEPGEDEYRIMGDPTEGALVVAASRFGLHKDRLEKELPRIAELPFDSQRKRMTTLHLCQGDNSFLPDIHSACIESLEGKASRHLSFTKGAVDGLLDVSTRVWTDQKPEPMTPEYRRRILDAHDRLAQDGMRVLGVAFRAQAENDSTTTPQPIEIDLIFVGLVGMVDPPRPEVKQAVQSCGTAGIRSIMITGDHPLTARHIADQLGISTQGGVLTGIELDQMSKDRLDQAMQNTSVYARVSPKHKLRLVQTLQDQKHVVAMTGDGVNDAPALKQADIGVAMGITGTDVTKETADMVLRDDNFATIVAAVEEGRIIFDNIRKFIKYMLSANCGELWVMLLAPFAGMPLPLLPLQILWINLVTDGPPALALGMERAESGTMQRPPYPANESIFRRGLGWDILWVGLLMGALSLGLGYVYWERQIETWQTMIFTSLTFSQMALALASRSEKESLFQMGLTTNLYLLGGIMLTIILQFSVVYWQPLQNIFHTNALSGYDMILCVSLSMIVFAAVELKKWIIRRM